MVRRILFISFACLIALTGILYLFGLLPIGRGMDNYTAGTAAVAQDNSARTLEWEELIQPGAYDVFDDWDYVDSLTDEQIDELWYSAEAATNPELDGELVSIPGFMVPLDAQPGRRVSEFVFVPYQGACIHTPPPPPNQTILVSAPRGVRLYNNWDPVVVTGVINRDTEETDVAVSGFSLELQLIEEFEYDDSDQAYQTAQGAHGT